jgi:hypothetical protein
MQTKIHLVDPTILIFRELTNTEHDKPKTPLQVLIALLFGGDTFHELCPYDLYVITYH